MSVIYKYKIDGAKLEFEWRKDSVVRYVGAQENESFMWVEHAVVPESSTSLVKRTFLVKATGEYFKSAGLTYVGTWQVGMYVFHLYRITTTGKVDYDLG